MVTTEDRRVGAPRTEHPGRAGTDGEETTARRNRPVLRWARRVISLGLVVGGLVAVYGRRHQIHQAIDQIGHPAWWWLVAACVTQASSMVAFARLQRWLLRCGGVNVRLRDMVEITLAGNAMSTSLPGGAAWAAGWIWGQLRRRRVNRVLAGWVVLVAGALASFALFLLVVVGAFLAGSHGPVQSLRWTGLALLGLGVAIAGVVTWVVRSEAMGDRWRSRVANADDRQGRGSAAVRLVDGFSRRIRIVTPSPLAWLEALGLALYKWLADLMTLTFVILVVHAHVPWRGVVVAYALTQIAASIPITPGGLAVVEASLAALLTAYGMSAQSAITVVLLYRLISFWFLVPIGWASWGYLEAVQRRLGRSPDESRHRHHPWAEHLHVRRSKLDSRRGPEHIGRPKPCEGCTGNPL